MLRNMLALWLGLWEVLFFFIDAVLTYEFVLGLFIFVFEVICFSLLEFSEWWLDRYNTLLLLELLFLTMSL